MKIFLSSTAYDLNDLRSKFVDILTNKGHEVIFHESPTFPAKYDLHSHDQCIIAVESCDTLICILDRRYGGKYAGDLLKNHAPLKFSISGFDNKGERLKADLEIPVKDMSITWCEVQRAYALNKNVITFARQRLMDEKETRRYNQYLKTFRPSYAEKNELFDMIDWITKQRRNNWIVPFTDIVDFEKKLETYVAELGKRHIRTKPNKKQQTKKVCIIVEGEVDRAVVQHLIRKDKIKGDFVIIPAYGKYRILQNSNDYLLPFSNAFDHVLVLVDTDAKNASQLATFRQNLEILRQNLIRENISLFGANPSVESWIVAGINEKIYRHFEGLIDKERFTESYGLPALDNIRRLMKDYDVSQAIELSADLRDFLSAIRDQAFIETSGTN